MIYTTSSAQETKELGKKIAQEYKYTGAVITLDGNLGAGKTTLTQGFAEGLNLSQKILSPTFVIQRQYEIPDSDKIFYHLDLYRLDPGFDTKDLGITELLNDHQNLILIEWPDRLGDKIPSGTIKIKIKILSENERQIEIE